MNNLKDNSREVRRAPENGPELKVTLLDRDQKDYRTTKIFKRFQIPIATLPVKLKLKKSRIFDSPFVILILMALVLMSAAILLWWSLSQNQTQPPALSPPSPTPKPRAFSPEAVIAFSKYHDASSSALILYDITQERELSTVTPVQLERDGLVSLGPWSPDGRYLPILIIRGSNSTNPLYWFDTLDGQARQIVDARDKPDLISSVSSFNYLSRWLQNDILVFNLRTSPEENTDELVLVSLSGEVNHVSRPSKLIHGNRHLEISVPSVTDSTTQPEATRQIKLVGRVIKFNVKGDVIGLVDNTLVTVESPKIPDFTKLSENKSLTTSLRQAVDEANAEKLLEEALRPTGDWYLHFYKVADGSRVNSISLTEDSWFTIQAQIRPNRGTIIIHQQDKQLPPFTSRYIEIDPKKADERRVVAEGPGEVSEERTYGNSFYLSADGDWLIGYAPSEDPQTYPLGKTILAWQIDSGEKLILCQDACDQIRVFNPEALRLK